MDFYKQVCGIPQALLIATGCCIYPNGWSSREIRDVCGPDSEAYRLDSNFFTSFHLQRCIKVLNVINQTDYSMITSFITFTQNTSLWIVQVYVLRLLSDILVSVPSVHWRWNPVAMRDPIPEGLPCQTELFPHLTPPSHVHLLPEPAPEPVSVSSPPSPAPSSPAEL
ncbi:unnamed protein product [Larinioides sclopetarius]|uniref:Uncharacterized protein n=1 Tax=Larinioides sclopetarius TaxID=280406 RepID=A0AAV2A7B5_9ARAC